MRRLLALLALAAVAVAGAGAGVAPADAATSKKKRTAAKVVCVKKTVKTKSGRKVRRKVCRKRKAPARRPAPVVLPAPILPPPAPAPAAAPAPEPAPGPTPAGPVQPTPPPVAPACDPGLGTRLLATADDLDGRGFVLTFSRLCLRSGTTTVQLDNRDEQPHNLHLAGLTPAQPARAVIEHAEGGDRPEAPVTLTAGTWRLYCAIRGHEKMTGTVTVVD